MTNIPIQLYPYSYTHTIRVFHQYHINLSTANYYFSGLILLVNNSPFIILILQHHKELLLKSLYA